MTESLKSFSEADWIGQYLLVKRDYTVYLKIILKHYFINKISDLKTPSLCFNFVHYLIKKTITNEIYNELGVIKLIKYINSRKI